MESIDKLISCMVGHGVEKLYYKLLAPNDNSKNQPYFGSDLSSLNIFPTKDLIPTDTGSKKKGAKGKIKYLAPLQFMWLDDEGTGFPAPNAQLIFYPQYPEVRFSGFLQGCKKGPSQYMDPKKNGRDIGRVLFMGVTTDDRIYGFLASPDSNISKEAISNLPDAVHGLFNEIYLTQEDDREILLSNLLRIHNLGWIKGKRLCAKTGDELTCNNPNCGGYTLEAELGITPNGIAEPDFMGWEVKQFGVTSFDKVQSKVITLMTPEPSGGHYQEKGVESFIRSFGYADTNGVQDRLNFGGVHKIGVEHHRTNLTLRLLGYDEDAKKITDLSGGIGLVAQSGEVAALWHFNKLIDHWKKKHAKAVYVPSICQKKNSDRFYNYAETVSLGVGTDFLKVLSALQQQDIYYDPGIKMENASASKPKIKRRSQFRIKSGMIGSLYHSMDEVKLIS